jgi:O-antigen/teichoic acid export membrane protein
MSREGRLAKNTFILAIGTFLPRLASFITIPILTGCLTQEEYGMYDLITVLVSLILPTATLQIQTAAFRFLIDKRENKDEVKRFVTNIFAFIVPTSLIALIILFFCMPSYSVVIRLCICAYFFADILVNGARQVIRGLANNLSYSLSAIISAVGNMMFAVIAVWYLRLGLLGGVIALCAASIFSLIFLIVKERLYNYIDIREIRKSTLKELIGYSWPMVPNSMSMWVMRVSDRFVITLFMGVSANAVYSVANKIPSLLTLAQSTFTMAWQENASIVSKDEDSDAYYTAMFQTMYDLMSGFFGVFIAAAPVLFAVLIRGNYGEAYCQIPVLFLGMFFYSMSSFLGGIYVAYKETRSVGITTMAAAVCNLIVDLATIKLIGLYAASVSTLVSYVFLFIFRLVDVRKLINLQFDIKHIMAVLGILIIECVLCFQQKIVLNILNLAIGVVTFFVLNKTFLKTVFKSLRNISYLRINKCSGESIQSDKGECKSS